jgi:hypothetical protein
MQINQHTTEVEHDRLNCGTIGVLSLHQAYRGLL